MDPTRVAHLLDVQKRLLSAIPDEHKTVHSGKCYCCPNAEFEDKIIPDSKLNQANAHHVQNPLERETVHRSNRLCDFRVGLTTGKIADVISGLSRDSAIDAGATFVVNSYI